MIGTFFRIYFFKHLKAFSFIITLLTVIVQAGAQNSEPGLAEEFEKGLPAMQEEKIFLHIAKTFYLPGEIIWFKMYVTDARLRGPLSISKVGYAELLDSENKPVLQVKIPLDSGSGSGSLVVPAYLATGNYTIRAYTNLLKNHPPQFYFHQQLSIVNAAKTNNAVIPSPESLYTVQFFPEGGNLVSGLQNNIAFKVHDRFGKSINATGAVIDQRNDTIVRFSPLQFGLGRFKFTPLAGNDYKAIIYYADGKINKINLPEIVPNGYTLEVTEENTSNLKIRVLTNTSPAHQNIYLVVHSLQRVSVALTGEVNEGKTEFVIPKNKLREGISCFTVFNGSRQAVAERLFFIRPQQQLQIGVETNGTDFTSRMKIDTKISVNDPSGRPVSADLSMAVMLIDSLQPLQTVTIRNYLWLTSELKGIIESPDYYFTSAAPDVAEATDNLVLTHGWRKLDPVQRNTAPRLFIPEYAGHIVTGKVTDRRSGQPAKDIIVYLSVPGERFHFSTCRSDENGRIRFDIKKIFGTENIIVQTNNLIDSTYRIDIDNPFSENYISSETVALTISINWQQQLLARITGAQVQNAFANTQPEQYYLPNFYDTTAFFGKPDNSYMLDDYTRFTTMEEVMREYVTEVQVRRAQGNFRYKMLNLPYKLYFEDNPLVLLDGVPVFDIDKIIAFDPLKVKKLDIVSRKYFQGAVSYDGIASYNTYDGDLGGYQLDASSLIIEYAGLQLQRQFYSPAYETLQQVNNRIPDYRNLLYWSPDMKTQRDGKKEEDFYSSDLPGTYAIIVQGLSGDGSSGSGMKIITVKNK